jgi:hypothetical protein
VADQGGAGGTGADPSMPVDADLLDAGTTPAAPFDGEAGGGGEGDEVATTDGGDGGDGGGGGDVGGGGGEKLALGQFPELTPVGLHKLNSVYP